MSDEYAELANQLRQMADDETNGSDRWWTLARAAELLEGDDGRYIITDKGRAMLKGGE